MLWLSDSGRSRLLENRVAANGEAGAAWVEGLPALIERMVEAWSLTPLAHFENLSYNYVSPMVTSDGVPVVLKLSYPDHDALCEEEALRAFDGNACARLLPSDSEVGAMLIERIEPGQEVSGLGDDVAETSAVASVMRGVRRVYDGNFAFPRARDWVASALAPAAMPGRKHEFVWMERALRRIEEIAAEPSEELLLHGDLHHANVLSGGREPWLAIDPHGVIGEAEWELAPFIFNRLEFYPRLEWPAIILRRADQLRDELGLERDRVYAWSTVRALQSAFWSLRDSPSSTGPVFEGAIECARVLAREGER